MQIRVRDLELRPLEFEQEYPPGSLELGNELRQHGILRAKGTADLVREEEGHSVILDIRVRGSFEATLEIACARCLEAVVRQVKNQFDLLYRPRDAEKRGEESSISEAETEISFYHGDGIALEDALQEQILLALPARTLCRSDCKGLCPECGRNRNLETCHCEPQLGDTRWDALKNVKLQ